MARRFEIRLPGGPWIAAQVPREFAEAMGWEVRYATEPDGNLDGDGR